MRRFLCLVIVPAALFVAACSGANPVAPSVVAGGLEVADTSPALGQVLSKGKGRGPERQLEGVIESMPSDPAGSFVVSGLVVTTDSSTVFRFRGADSSLSALAVGARVHVKGQQTAAGVLAAIVMIQQGAPVTGTSDPEPPPPPPPTADEVCDNGIDDDGDGLVDEECEPPPPPPTPVAAFELVSVDGDAQCQLYTCGFVFSPSENLTVQALGQWDQHLDGLLTAGAVGLWSSDGMLVASAVVPSGTAASLEGAYRYVTLDQPVELAAGQTYVVASAIASSTAPTFSPVGAHPALTLIEGRIAFGGSGVLVYPSDARAGVYYGGANFLFVSGAP
jgi:hypothetical protein